MYFPSYVHTVLPDVPEDRWLVQAQGRNECGCTTPANALNLLFNGTKIFDKNDLIRQAGLLFQRRLGGSPSFVTGDLLRHYGAGTHFGNLAKTDGDALLRDLVKRRIPICIELGQMQFGPLKVYGEHSVLVVGYSDPYRAADGTQHEEYYLVDAAYSVNGEFGLHTNNIDRDGDGVVEVFPGNRTLERADFWQKYPTGIYFPVFPSQAAHDAWYRQHIRVDRGMPLLGKLRERFLSGSIDHWLG